MAEFLLKGIRKRYRLNNLEISPRGREQLKLNDWPGNVRELAHELERAVVLADGDSLDFQNLSAGGASPAPASNVTVPADDWLNESWEFPDDGGFAMEDAIVRLIKKALDQANGNVSGASRLLGVPRDFIRYRLKKQGE